jgi:microcystin-dependent protein
MSEPFLGQIGLFGFAFAPRNWAQCNGQLMAISQNQALFALLGTYYGGNGQTTFGLPDLRGKAPVHAGNGYAQGQQGGTETVALSVAQLPSHTHQAQCSTTPTALSPAGNYWAADTVGDKPFAATPNSQTKAAAIGNQGQGQAHDNMAPYAVINFCIALAGIFPSRN